MNSRTEYNSVRLLAPCIYSRTPEIETTELSQSQASLNFGIIIYRIKTQVQQPKIIETCI